ncbi:nicotinamidase [Candidatus Saccharibacteria bacterium]|nr:nicotinamidase [Candidatus Saccharibacteria bacterium]MCB9821744.1 nicotinamidase [Candidatus Nomurabacteria bacterium]
MSLVLPNFYQPTNAEVWGYNPDIQALAGVAEQYRQDNKILPAAGDRRRIELLLIDLQGDFTYPEGTLYVGGRSGRGAIEDIQRVAEFIYRNLDVITNITTTLDTHFAFQIFFPWFWQNAAGNSPAAHTIITTEDIRKGVYTPNPAVAGLLVGGNYQWLLKQVAFYVAELERAGKYQLYLWPPHTLLGSVGHVLNGVIHEARMFHALTRFSQSGSEIKGGNALTENYSVLRPEVLMRWDGEPLDQKNTRFIESLLENDYVVIGGEAASHCVSSSIDDLLGEILAKDPALAAKVYILADCMSAVVVPDGNGGFLADFTPQAEAALERFRQAGMHVVKSTDPITSWPDFRL